MRVIDANCNRLRDGLRVLEDTLRFVYDSDNYKKIRRIRLQLFRFLSNEHSSLVAARSSDRDIGKNLRQGKYKNVGDLFRANFSRCSEALRVLEEYYRLVSSARSRKMKEFRFKLYEVERKFHRLTKYETIEKNSVI